MIGVHTARTLLGLGEKAPATRHRRADVSSFLADHVAWHADNPR